MLTFTRFTLPSAYLRFGCRSSLCPVSLLTKEPNTLYRHNLSPGRVQTTPTVRPRSRLTFGSGRHFTQVTKDDATPLRTRVRLLRVTALNSTPVLFYPTDTFAELEWLVAVLETYAHAVRVPERNKPANNPYRHCAGMPLPPSVQAAKPGPRRGAVQRPTLNNQASSKMLGLHLRSGRECKLVKSWGP